MKTFRIIVVLLAAFFAVNPIGLAQDASTQGTEFWVSFMSNGHKYHSAAPEGNWVLTQVLISGKRECSGTIANPQLGWSTDFTVQANSITTVQIPDDVAYVDGSSEQVLNRGLKITSSDTISVFCTNIAHLSFDASYVLPTQSLADDYIVQTYDQSNNPSSLPYVKENQTSAFLIVATEDGTTIDITPSVKTYGGRQAGREFTINLNKGQVYQVRSNKDSNERDLSGTRVTARDCKRIAVFNGNTLTAIPRTSSSYDHIFEQAMPIQAWGKRFVVTGSLERESDYVKIVSAADNNEILRNGEPIAMLDNGESFIFEMRSVPSCFIESTGRSAVYLYQISQGGNSIGDPSVVWIAPIEQRIDDITFSTFNNTYIDIDTHHVNIIVNTEDAGTVYLDGNLLPANSFSPVEGTNEFVFARKNISHGVHRLQCAHGFNAHVYGFGIAKGYAYLVGSKTSDLTMKVHLNDMLVNNGDSISHCAAETITFSAEVNLSSYDLRWDFGDGTTSSQNPVTHTYNDNRLYQASLIIATDEIGGCMFSTSDTSSYFIDARLHYEYDEAELCKGETYTEHGFNVVVTNDTILRKAIDNPEHPLCPDSLLVQITALPGYYAAYSDTLCWQGEPITYNEHGFNILVDHPDTYTEQISTPISGGCDSIVDLTLIVTDRIISPFPVNHSSCSESFTWNGVTYTESGDYEQIFPSVMGCDSIVELHIILNEAVEGGTDTVTGSCNAYFWNGQYYDMPGFYTDTVQNVFGCDSIVHLQLSMALAPDPSEIQSTDPNNETPHSVISPTEFEIKTYDFTLWDNNEGSEWDSVVWSFESDITWRIEPYGENGRFCTVSVNSRVEDTVWLNATVYGHCEPGTGIERRFWLVCTFFGLDEQETPMQIDIVPNPNNGKMDIVFGQAEGKIGAKVYDMTGQLVDQFELIGSTNSRHSYTINDYRSGIYLFVFNGNGKNAIRKVVVTK